jgi:O-acetyl-ADP-ribose deacetylase (regulator of RNase III)
MDIAHTDNVYRAMWAMLLAVQRHNEHAERRIAIVACPGLGTATGRVPYPEAARQMSLAYRYFLEPPSTIDWRLAGMRQAEIGYGGDIGRDIPPRTTL